jgi:formylglycine-generating enzyme required for sulfatase activity
MKKIFLIAVALVIVTACTPSVENKPQQVPQVPPVTEDKPQQTPPVVEVEPQQTPLPAIEDEPAEELSFREKENLKNPLFQSSLPFLKNPVPVDDSEATTEAEMKQYLEKIPGTELTFRMIPIKGGTFKMGSPDSEEGRNEDEGPQIEVEVQPFWMEEHETTWLEFEQFALKYLRQDRKPSDNLSERERAADALAAPTGLWGTSDSHANKGKPGYPAAGMSLYAAQTYCKWLTTITGRYYRLPTEAEWEYACRAGSTTAFSFGDDVDKLDDYAVWFFTDDDKLGEAHKIKTKKPNAWGLYDMHGNMAEWVLEHYAADTYSQRKPGTFAAPVKPAITMLGDGSQYGRFGHIVRGGSCDYTEPAEFRSARRIKSDKEWSKDDPQYPRSVWWLTNAGYIGFRVVRPLDPPKTDEEAKQIPITAF